MAVMDYLEEEVMAVLMGQQLHHHLKSPALMDYQILAEEVVVVNILTEKEQPKIIMAATAVQVSSSYAIGES